MTRMLLAGVLASLLVIVLGPLFIELMRRRSFGQNVREDGPQSHIQHKSGTPTLGGLLIIMGMSIPYWVVGREHTSFGLAAWVVMLLCAGVGFWDDATKLVNRRSAGLSGRAKITCLALITAGLGWAAQGPLGLSTVLEVPFTPYVVDLGAGWYVLLFFMLVGAANTVNLTDGLDGLATGTVVLSVAAFTAISFIVWDRGLWRGNELLAPVGSAGALDLAIFCSALGGALIGFLWWNAHPAAVFMGDTGSLALGGTLAALAVLLKVELLLAIIGGLFVVEGMSVMLQVAIFKLKRRRLFLMAPIHHHFELKGWSETQVMIRFVIVASLFSATGFTIWFRTH